MEALAIEFWNSSPEIDGRDLLILAYYKTMEPQNVCLWWSYAWGSFSLAELLTAYT